MSTQMKSRPNRSGSTDQLLTQIRNLLETQTAVDLWSCPWLTPELASRILPMTAAGIKEALRAGDLPGRKLRGKWMIDPRAVSEAIEGWEENGRSRKVRTDRKASEILATMNRRKHKVA